MWRNEGDCEWAIAQNKNEGVGYMPLARLKTLSEHMYDVSRRTIDAQFSELRRLAPTAPFVFITSFNEYAEGTMVDASSSPNPEG
jgi:hypothetical protein